jgi:hypothetical protein
MNGSKSLLSYALMATLPMSVGLFRVWVHQDAVQMGYALSAEEHRREALRASAHELEVELAASRSPARLASLAGKLGLKPPAPGQLVGTSAAPRIARADVARGADGRP